MDAPAIRSGSLSKKQHFSKLLFYALNYTLIDKNKQYCFQIFRNLPFSMLTNKLFGCKLFTLKQFACEHYMLTGD